MKTFLLYDTTLRDGTQMEGISLSVNDKVMIARRLDQFGVHYIEGGWPGSNPKDMAFFKEIKKAGIKKAKIAAFGSTRRANVKVSEDPQVKALLDSETKVVTIFGKSWDLHVTDVFRTTLKENLSMIADTVAYLKSKKREVIYDAEHFLTVSKRIPITRSRLYRRLRKPEPPILRCAIPTAEVCRMKFVTRFCACAARSKLRLEFTATMIPSTPWRILFRRWVRARFWFRARSMVSASAVETRIYLAFLRFCRPKWAFLVCPRKNCAR